MSRITHGIAVLAILGVPCAAFAQRHVEAETCYKNVSHADATVCLERRAAQSALAVKEAEAALGSALKKADDVAEHINRALSALDVASHEYVRYRKAQCNLLASLAFGGNGSGDRRFLCQIELDTRRAADVAQEAKVIGGTH